MSKKLLVKDSHRDEEWLIELLSTIWYEHFLDVQQLNDVQIVYGQKARRRLGSLKLDKDGITSIITINSIYQDLDVPEEIIKATIVHEMTHYAHGFNSPLKQKQKHPHSGGVIRKEFAERGLEDLYIYQQKWLKDNWTAVVTKYYSADELTRRPRRRPNNRVAIRMPWWMGRI
jgi:hypothetical protein